MQSLKQALAKAQRLLSMQERLTRCNMERNGPWLRRQLDEFRRPVASPSGQVLLGLPVPAQLPALRPAMAAVLQINLPAGFTGEGGQGADALARLGEVCAPSLVIWGDLDFPQIQGRCLHIAAAMPSASARELAGAAQPSLEQPAAVTAPLMSFEQRMTRSYHR
jgi:pimeloyl-ACP methyl ester carboxylesterase